MHRKLQDVLVLASFLSVVALLEYRVLFNPAYRSVTGYYCMNCSQAAKDHVDYTDGTRYWYCERHQFDTPESISRRRGDPPYTGANDPRVRIFWETGLLAFFAWFVCRRHSMAGPYARYAYAHFLVFGWRNYWSHTLFEVALVFLALWWMFWLIWFWIRVDANRAAAGDGTGTARGLTPSASLSRSLSLTRTQKKIALVFGILLFVCCFVIDGSHLFPMWEGMFVVQYPSLRFSVMPATVDSRLSSPTCMALLYIMLLFLYFARQKATN